MWRIAHDDEWGTLLPNLEEWSDDISNVIEAFHLFVWLCEMGGEEDIVTHLTWMEGKLMDFNSCHQ